MNEVVMLHPVPGDLMVFDPDATRVKLAAIEGDIVTWRLLKDWPKLEEAVDAKIAEQAAFVANWDANVRSQGRQPKVALGQPLSVSDAKALWGFDKPTVSRWRSWLTDIPTYRTRLILGTHRAAGLIPDDNHRAKGTGENEWFTPEQFIKAATSVMGAIDLDPASHPVAQETIQASKYFTKEDDALTKDWYGRVWLNPPYARTEIEPFIKKLLGELESNRVPEAILLTHSYTDTVWFQLAATSAAMLCFTLGRVRFTDIDGEESNPTQGQAFFYFGPNVRDFAIIFAQYGLVVCPS